MLMTTGFEIQGRTIAYYNGIVTGECALGTGFLSSLGAGLADFLGTNSTMYADKLRAAKEHALRDMEKEARRVNADAIIGIDINYTAFSADIMGVIATGTAVKLEGYSNDIRRDAEEEISREKEEKSQGIRLLVQRSNMAEPFRIHSVLLTNINDSLMASLDILAEENLTLDGIKAELLLRNIFRDEETLENLCFLHFERRGRRHLLSNRIAVPVTNEMFESLKSIEVVIEKYVCGKDIFIPDKNIIELTDILDDESNSEKELVDTDEIIKHISELANAKEIKDYMIEFNKDYPEFFSEEIINAMEKRFVTIERLYGKDMGKNLKIVKEYLGKSN